MSSHPGSTLKDAIELALFIKEQKLRPEQVQDFYPTPGTISTAMFYTELDPYTLDRVYVAKTAEEKAMQRALMRYFAHESRPLVIKALRIAGRTDLIGNGKNCLIQADNKPSYDNRNRNNYPSRNNKGRYNESSRKRKK